MLGLCKVASREEIKEKGYSLTPSAYVGVAPVEDDGVDFEERMSEIHRELLSLQAESNELEDHIRRLPRHVIEPGDILYSRRGDVGRCAFAQQKEVGWLCGTGCLRVTTNPAVVDARFIFYQLQQASTIRWVEKHAVGATI